MKKFRLEPELNWSEQMTFGKMKYVDFTNSLEHGQTVRIQDDKVDIVKKYLSDITNGRVEIKNI